MNELTVFENAEFGKIRTLAIDGNPWFVGKDIAEALGYQKARNAIAVHVEEEDKKVAPIQGSLGGMQQMTIINESGLYSLIFSSKLPEAKEFKHWVTSEVLPSIRNNGAYMTEEGQILINKLQPLYRPANRAQYPKTSFTEVQVRFPFYGAKGQIKNHCYAEIAEYD